jgi:hypothetical protein
MRSHRVRAPFQAAEIYQAWEQVVETPEYRRWRADRNKMLLSSECEHGCEGGWIFVEASNGRSGVKPCPQHRPNCSF